MKAADMCCAKSFVGHPSRTIARRRKAVPAPDGLCRARPDAGRVSGIEGARGARVESGTRRRAPLRPHAGCGTLRLEADLQAVRKEMADAQRMVAAQDPHTDSGVGRATMAQYRFQAERGMRYRGENAFKLYDTFGLPLDFIRMHAVTRASLSIRTVSSAPWKSSANARAPHGKAPPSRLPSPPTST